MKTYNEIKTAIENLPTTVKPVEVRMFDQVHSDGLTQTHQDLIYFDKDWECETTYLKYHKKNK